MEEFGGRSVGLVDAIVPSFPEAKQEHTLEEVLSYEPDVGRGKRVLSQCYMCHKLDNQGIEFGPDLTAYAKGNPTEILIKAIIDPSADISHGFESVRVTTKDNKTIEGFVISEGNPLVLRVFGGADMAIDQDQIAKREDLHQSFMPSAASLDISAEHVMNLVAYLKSF